MMRLFNDERTSSEVHEINNATLLNLFRFKSIKIKKKQTNLFVLCPLVVSNRLRGFFLGIPQELDRLN